MSRTATVAEFRKQAPAILPSLLLCDFGNLAAEVDRLAAAPALHLDVMDGHFVPNFTYGMPIVKAFRDLTDRPLDVHLMIEQPQRYLEAFRDAGADLLTIHVEATDHPGHALEQIHSLGLAAGLALNPATPLEVVVPYLDQCDLVLVMSVPAGFGGQAFHPVALEKLEQLRQLAGERLLLQVDGGVGPETIAACAAAGADALVVGSAIFRQPDYGQAIRSLRELAMTSL